MASQIHARAVAFAAAVFLSSHADATPAEMAAQMDTNARLYNTPECVQARAAAANFATTSAQSNIAVSMVGASFGLLGAALAGAAAGANEEQRERAFTKTLVARCGEEAFLSYFTAKAEKGDSDAAAWLGHAYRHNKDWPQAIRWYQAALEDDNAEAETELGTIYFEGNGVAQDRAQAMQLWQRAASHKVREAQRRLGLAYLQDQNYAKAHEYLEDAARQRDAEGAYALAGLYEQGLGVSRSDELAFRWYSIAALGQFSDAATKRGAVAARMTTGQIDDGIHDVEECFMNGHCRF